MNELQTGVEPSLAVLPQPPVLLQPSKAALYYPALGHYLKAVKFIPLRNLHCHMRAQYHFDFSGKWSTNVACIRKHAAHSNERILAALERLQRSLAIRHIRCCDGQCVWQSIRIDCNMALDSANSLACVIAFAARRISVLDALCVHYQERAVGAAPQFASGRANLIFLAPARAR